MGGALRGSKALGRGEGGTVLGIVGDPTRVLKCSILGRGPCACASGGSGGSAPASVASAASSSSAAAASSPDDVAPLLKWQREVALAQAAAGADFAPHIHAAASCARWGVLLMDRVTPLTAAFPGIRAADDSEDAARLPDAVQHSIVALVKRAAATGMLHNDTTLRNLALSTPLPPSPPSAGGAPPPVRALLLDFEFAQRRTWDAVRGDLDAAVAFSLFQLLEHSPPSAAKKTVIGREAAAALRAATAVRYGGGGSGSGSGSGGAPPPPPRPGNAAHSRALLKEWRANAAATSTFNDDVWLGCLAYAALLQLPQQDRYETGARPLYDYVYAVRRGGTAASRDA